MKNILILLSLTLLISSCKNKAEETVTKKDLIIKLESHFNTEYSDADIDNLGNFKFDMGSASAGRVFGNLRDVFITMEILPERPGCADVCPEMAVIHFKCENNQKCVTDPANPQLYGYFDEGIITFVNLETAKEVYQLLNEIKKTL